MSQPTDYPRSYAAAKDGSVTAHLGDMRAVTTRDFMTGEPTDKVIADLRLVETGEPVTLWLEGVLKTQFTEELRNRRKRGKDGFEPDELVEIEYLGLRKSGRTGNSYHNFNVTFEHAAPKPTAAELLLADEPADTSAAAEEPIVDVPAADDVPF